jgi:hypothetical protein
MQFRLSRYWKVQISAWTSLSLISIGFQHLYYTPDLKFITTTLLTSGIGLVVSHIMRFGLDRLKVFPKPSTKQLVYFIAICFSGTVLGTLLLTAYLISFTPAFFKDNFARQFYSSLSRYISVCFPWAIIYCFARYTRESRHHLKSPNNSINPHTEEVKQDLTKLFNRQFNKIDQLITKEPDAAKKAINELSQLLRQRLKQSGMG